MKTRSENKKTRSANKNLPALPHPRKKQRPLPLPKAWPPPASAFSLSLYQPSSIPFDLEKTLKFLSEEDPAAFLDYSADAVIHAGCGLGGAPAGLVGANAAATALKLRAWVLAQFVAVSPNCTVNVGGAPSTSAFHRLSNHEWGNLINAGVAFRLWSNNMAAGGVSLGRLYWVTPVPGGGGGGGRSPQAQHFRGWFPFSS